MGNSWGLITNVGIVWSRVVKFVRPLTTVLLAMPVLTLQLSSWMAGVFALTINIFSKEYAKTPVLIIVLLGSAESVWLKGVWLVKKTPTTVPNVLILMFMLLWGNAKNTIVSTNKWTRQGIALTVKLWGVKLVKRMVMNLIGALSVWIPLLQSKMGFVFVQTGQRSMPTKTDFAGNAPRKVKLFKLVYVFAIVSILMVVLNVLKEFVPLACKLRTLPN